MIICVKCKKEMKCIKNGVGFRWNITHVYYGDIYKCPMCNNETAHTNSIPSFNDSMISVNDILMDSNMTLDKAMRKLKSINVHNDEDE